MMEAMRPSTSRIADCPVALPSRESTYARALHRACVILEGIPQLARHLEVSEWRLRAWLEGREDPPLRAFLAAVEIILLHVEKGGAA